MYNSAWQFNPPPPKISLFSKRENENRINKCILNAVLASTHLSSELWGTGQCRSHLWNCELVEFMSTVANAKIAVQETLKHTSYLRRSCANHSSTVLSKNHNMQRKLVLDWVSESALSVSSSPPSYSYAQLFKSKHTNQAQIDDRWRFSDCHCWLKVHL